MEASIGGLAGRRQTRMSEASVSEAGVCLMVLVSVFMVANRFRLRLRIRLENRAASRAALTRSEMAVLRILRFSAVVPFRGLRQR